MRPDYRNIYLLAWVALVAGAARPAQGAESRWIRLRSANFEMYSGGSERSARDTIREFEQVRGFFLQAFGGSGRTPIPVRLVAFGSAKAFEPYRINDFAVAYYQQTGDRDYIVMSHGGADIFPVAVHEYTHLLVRHAGVNLPPWINEGLAELYSTLRPVGGKILIGALIAGRQQALLEEKWVPLSVILAANERSPYYNEKSKAGSLYNEGWALTHMLALRAEYRPRFGQLVRALAAGKESAQALAEVYGKSVTQVEKDLQAYLRGSSFQGVLVSATLEKGPAEIPAEPVGDFDVELMLTDLMEGPGKEAARKAALERLAQQDPKRPEPHEALGYMAWRREASEEAKQQFGKAFELGDRDPKMLWDYGRLAERGRREEAIPVLSALLSQDANRMEVRLELAAVQLNADRAQDALDTLNAVHRITPQDAPRFFQIAVYAQLRKGDRKGAQETAKHFQDVAKTETDRAKAEVLVHLAAGNAQVQNGPVETSDAGKPTLRRTGPDHAAEASPHAPERLSASGKFVELECLGAQARMIVETADGRKVFLIEDPGKVVITAGSGGTVEMACGPQKAPPKVAVEYDPPAAGRKGLDGIVRTLAF